MKTKYKILMAVGLVICTLACIFGGQALAERERQKQLAEWRAQQETVSPAPELTETPEATATPQVTPTVTATPEADNSPEAVATETPTSNEAEAGNKKGEDTVIVDEDGNVTIIPDFEHQAETADKLTKPDELGAEANMGGSGGYIPTKDGVYYGDDYDYGESETPAPTTTPTPTATPAPTPAATPKPAATPAPTPAQEPDDGKAYYLVEKYEQNEDKNGYTCVDSRVARGEIGKLVGIGTKDYDGFVFNKDHPNNIVSGTVTKDGSLVLRAYFDRSNTSGNTTQKPAQTAKPSTTPDNDDWGDPPDYEGSEHFELSQDGKWVWIANNRNGYWKEYHRVGNM